jgi:hypothetical protein
MGAIDVTDLFQVVRLGAKRDPRGSSGRLSLRI